MFLVLPPGRALPPIQRLQTIVQACSSPFIHPETITMTTTTYKCNQNNTSSRFGHDTGPETFGPFQLITLRQEHQKEYIPYAKSHPGQAKDTTSEAKKAQNSSKHHGSETHNNSNNNNRNIYHTNSNNNTGKSDKGNWASAEHSDKFDTDRNHLNNNNSNNTNILNNINFLNNSNPQQQTVTSKQCNPNNRQSPKILQHQQNQQKPL